MDDNITIPYDPNPASAANNRHHEGGYRNYNDWFFETFPPAGYPVYLYPGETEADLQSGDPSVTEQERPF